MFAKSVVQFMRTYGFDGLDLDWEYPGLKERGGKRADYDNYVLMTKELRERFNSAPEPFELTVAITGNLTKLEMGFDLEGLAKYVDWFNIMAYDLWGLWDPRQIALSHTDLRMIDEAVEYMSHFIQRSKLVLGLGSYARTYMVLCRTTTALIWDVPLKDPAIVDARARPVFYRTLKSPIWSLPAITTQYASTTTLKAWSWSPMGTASSRTITRSVSTRSYSTRKRCASWVRCSGSLTCSRMVAIHCRVIMAIRP